MPITGVIPQLRTTNLPQSIEFYVARLGFELAFTHDDFYAGIRVGASIFHLKLVDTPDPSIAFVAAGDHLHLYFTTTDVEAEARRLQGDRAVNEGDSWGLGLEGYRPSPTPRCHLTVRCCDRTLWQAAT